MRLSIILPSIRTENLQKCYDSVVASYSGEFELLICGFNSTGCRLDIKSINRGIWKFIPSFRSPNAAQQEALCYAQYEYISFMSDDGVFLPGALDKAVSMAEERTIVVGKYIEGDNPNPDMLKEDYYKFKYHKTYRLKGVPQDALIFNCGVISRKFMLELGGWDCQFEATTCAHADLGLRVLEAGAKMILMDEPIFKCSHQPGKSGDHKPIDTAMRRDLKRFKYKYSCQCIATTVNISSWQLTPEVWERFK